MHPFLTIVTDRFPLSIQCDVNKKYYGSLHLPFTFGFDAICKLMNRLSLINNITFSVNPSFYGLILGLRIQQLEPATYTSLYVINLLPRLNCSSWGWTKTQVSKWHDNKISFHTICSRIPSKFLGKWKSVGNCNRIDHNWSLV